LSLNRKLLDCLSQAWVQMVDDVGSQIFRESTQQSVVVSARGVGVVGNGCAPGVLDILIMRRSLRGSDVL